MLIDVQYKMKLGDYVQTIPTIGFNVETIKYKNVRFDCWDAGGQEKVPSLCGTFEFSLIILRSSVGCGTTTARTRRRSSSSWIVRTRSA